MNIQAMMRWSRNRYDEHKEERPAMELEDVIQVQTRDFWDDANKRLLEKQNDYSPDTEISSKVVALKLRKESRRLAHENNLDCSFVSQTDHYHISLLPCRINIDIETQTGNFSISAPHIPKHNFFCNEWQMGLNWIQDYLNIDIKSLEERKKKIKGQLYVTSKTAEIAQASIKSICNEQAKQKGLKCRMLSTWLKSEILFYKEDTNSKIINDRTEDEYESYSYNKYSLRDNEIKIFEILIYHKAFTNDPSLLLDFLNNPRESEIENTIKCIIFQTMTKSPKEILIGSDTDNMCLTCAVGILDNPSEKYKTTFAEECKRAGFAYEQFTTKNNKVLYFFMNVTLQDAKSFFTSYGLDICIFIKKSYSRKKDNCILGIELWQQNCERTDFKMIIHEEYEQEISCALQKFFHLYDNEFKIDFSFQEISMRFFQKYSWKTPSRLNEEAYVYLENAHKYCGSVRMRYRCRMYHKPQGWELENGLRNQYYEMWKNEN